MHRPVLLEATLAALDVKAGERYIDATAGEGGHFEAILRQGGVVLAIDWDIQQIKKLEQKFVGQKTLTLTRGNYANIVKLAEEAKFVDVSGILFDFGLSMEQIRTSGRGFSFKQLSEPLDMRIGDGEENEAASLINSSSEPELYDIFAKYSEDLHSQQVAHQIIVKRPRRIETVGDLTEVIDRAIEECKMSHDHSKEKVYARIFQALRIAVNHEFTNITAALEGAFTLLKPGGRIVIITFHSLEDRIVKNFIRNGRLKTVELDKRYKRNRASFERSALIRIITK